MKESSKMSSQQGLGKGLSALFSDTRVSHDDAAGGNKIIDVSIDKISSGENQPRTHFDEEKIRELAASIKENGLLQPVMLYSDDENNYRLIAGERRWRACKMLGMRTIQAIVRHADNARLAELSLIENIQREDLSTIEEAHAYKRLQIEYDYTQDLLAKRLGKSRAHVANMLRLLNLPGEVQNLVNQGQITGGHARALLTTEDPVALAKHVIEEKLSVRDTEKLAKKPLSASTTENKTTAAKRVIKRTLSEETATHSIIEDSDNPEVVTLRECLKLALGLDQVSIAYNEENDSGVAAISFASLEELDIIMQAAKIYAESRESASDVDSEFDNVHVEESI